MNLDFFFQEKSFPILILSPKQAIFFYLNRNKRKYTIEKGEEIKTIIFNKGVLWKENLEKVMSLLLEKYQFKEIGIILNFPGFLFQRITLPRTGDPQTSIVNYLQATLPLPLERYDFVYIEDIYRLSGNFANYNLFLFPKEIKEETLDVIQKLDLTAFFVVPAFEVILSNLIYKTLISISESFLVFYLDEDIAHVFFIDGLKIDKLFIEEINRNKIDFSLFFDRFKNYFESQGKKFKTLILSGYELNVPFYDILKIDTFDFLREGSMLLLKKIFEDRPFLDLLSLKPSRLYFLTRIRKPLMITSILLLSLSFIYLLTFAYLIFRFNVQKEKIRNEISKISLGRHQELEENLRYLIDITNKIESSKERRDLFLQLTKDYRLESLNEDFREAVFIINKTDLEKFKEKILKVGLDFSFQEEILDKDKLRVRIRW